MSGPGKGRAVSNAPRPTEGFDSFASALVRRLGLLPSLNFPCPQCYATGVVELAMASKPVEGPAVASPPSNAEEEEETQHPEAVLENDSSKHPEAANVKKTGVSGNPEKEETMLLPRVHSIMASSSCDVAGAENSNGRATKLVSKSKRKSKNGKALELTMADISPLFGLHLPVAAKQLGISMTSLKKICRDNGLDRWPGRQIRGLKSTIDGIERTTVGQGADSGNLKAGSMRSEIPKLQQELNELFHGTPAQIREKMQSPAAITANVYKRLYYKHGWRNRDAGAEKQPELERKEKLAPCTDGDPPASQSTPIADNGNACPSSHKYIRSRPRRILRSSSLLGSRDTEMKVDDIEGLLPEVHDITNVSGREVPESVVQALNGNNMTPETEIGEEGTGDGKVAVEEEGATVAEQSAECPKTESPSGKYGNKELQDKTSLNEC